MGKTYEELSGGVGRSVYFRSQRFRSRTLLGELGPHLRAGDIQARLYDLSMNGVSFHMPPETDAPDAGDELSLVLSLRNVEAFAGRGRVVRVENDSGRIKVAVNIIDDFIDIPRLSALHDSFAFEQALAQGVDVYAAVPVAYRRVCFEVGAFLNHWRDLLDRRERELREDRDDDSGTAFEAAEARAEAQMRVEWNALRQRANEACRAAFTDLGALRASKRLTELMVTRQLEPAPLWWRAYTKPLGYPGDFRMMNYMYDEGRHGESMWGRIMHQLGREERLAATVASRKDLMLEKIRNTIDGAAPTDEPVRIACLASGPAREVEEFLLRNVPSRPVVWTLIDQDDRALSFANDRLVRAAVRHGNRIRVNCLYTSFRQLVNDPTLLGSLEDQDLVYSAGFLDYLKDPVARSVVEVSYNLLTPGGELFFGNAADGPDVRWVPEFVLDWHMVYRSHETLRDLVSTAAGAPAESVADTSAAWNFVTVRRET